jgi:two-component system, chemotaxis family, sensor kinase CheA
MAKIKRDIFIAQFREEVNDHIQRISQKLFQLEEAPGDRKQILEEIFRIAHTLKGSSRMMGYAEISTLAHKMEDVFVELRDEHLELSQTVTNLLLYCLDTINYLVEGLYKNVARTADIDQIVTLFNDLIAGKPIDVPHVQSAFTTLATPPKGPPEKPAVEAEGPQYVRICMQDLDVILNLVGEVLINQYRYDGQLTDFQQFIGILRDHRQHLDHLHDLLRRGNGRPRPAQLLQISDRLDQHALQMLHHSKTLAKKIRSDGQQIQRIIENLQKHVIDIRMAPASRIFHQFPRLVRTTASRLGKQVELVLVGEETQIDSRIMEEMRDPLVHLIQNAIRHGIEPPEERQEVGKPPTGTITVSAHQEGNRIVIRVHDDGQGIDVERIREMALKHGAILRPEESTTISEQELYELLFQTGFSTAETVDDIAGRGFGLDIVRDHVDRVQGEIEVRSDPGQGTEFALKLPLTLTILNALLVRVAEEIFALPTASVVKTRDIYPDQIEQLGNMPVLVNDGALLPVVQLSNLLNVAEKHPVYQHDETPRSAEFDDPARQTLIVVQSEDRHLGLLVDDLVEEREIVIKHLGPCLKRVKNVAGATTLRDDIVIILFVRDLIRSADALLERTSIRPAALPHRQAVTDQARNVARILVVDDSLNTREVERAILQEAGYEVETAANGVEGLAALRSMAFDLVITDIEMPEMDGLDLTRQIKRDEILHSIPVIIVSTRTSDADQQQGLAAGASAYIMKGEFDESILLQTVGACLASQAASKELNT